MTTFGENVAESLRNAAELFQERNEVYGDNYAMVGRIMKAMFPEGAPSLETVDDYNKWHLFELAIVKLSRYANNYSDGHDDSLADLIVYIAMVRELDNEFRPVKKFLPESGFDMYRMTPSGKYEPVRQED